MSTTDLTHLVVDVLATIAPEADFDTLRRDLPLRDQLDIDSMDYLNFMIALNERTGIEIPESDYGRLTTIDECVEYLRSAGA